MAGLTLTLRPNERFLVGGCLLRNGPKRSSVTVENDDVLVLRLSDAIRPEEAVTPVRRAYYAAQRILAAEVTREEGARQLRALLLPLVDVFAGTPLADAAERARTAADQGRYHGTLAALRALFAFEDTALSRGEADSRIAC